VAVGVPASLGEETAARSIGAEGQGKSDVGARERVRGRHVEALGAAVHGDLSGRVSRDGRAERFAEGLFDEDGRDRDADVRAGHVDGASLVVVDDDSNGASVLGVDRLGGEVATAALDEGDLAVHGAVGEGASPVSRADLGGASVHVDVGAHATVERVGDDHPGSLYAVHDHGVVVEDGVARGVEATRPIQDEVLDVASHPGCRGGQACEHSSEAGARLLVAPVRDELEGSDARQAEVVDVAGEAAEVAAVVDAAVVDGRADGVRDKGRITEHVEEVPGTLGNDARERDNGIGAVRALGCPDAVGVVSRALDVLDSHAVGHEGARAGFGQVCRTGLAARVHRRCACEGAGEALADDGAIRGEADEHRLGVSGEEARAGVTVALRKLGVRVGNVTVVQRDEIEVRLGLEAGEGHTRGAFRAGQHPVAVVAVVVAAVHAEGGVAGEHKLGHARVDDFSCARERGAEAVHNNRAVRSELDHDGCARAGHCVGRVSGEAADTDVVNACAVVDVHVVKVRLGLEGGEGDGGSAGVAGVGPRARHAVLVVVADEVNLATVSEVEATDARIRGRGSARDGAVEGSDEAVAGHGAVRGELHKSNPARADDGVGDVVAVQLGNAGRIS